MVLTHGSGFPFHHEAVHSATTNARVYGDRPLGPVVNPLTRQGTRDDVEQHYSIDTLIGNVFSRAQIRAVVQADALCHAVASDRPNRMARVEFEAIATNMLPGVELGQVQPSLDLVTAHLRGLMAWFQHAQIEANVVGQSFLVIRAISPDTLLPPQNLMDDGVARASDGQLSMMSQSLTDDDRWAVTPLDWRDAVMGQLIGHRVLSGEHYQYSSDRRYLYRRRPNPLGQQAVTYVDGNGKQTDSYYDQNGLVTAASIEAWLSNPNRTPAELQSLDVVNATHVFQFVAEGYREDTLEGVDDDNDLLGTVRCEVDGTERRDISYNLSRFIPALIRYLSATNATVNRLWRSEFTLIRTEGLGERNLEIARALAQRSEDIPFTQISVVDPVAVLQNNLERLKEAFTGLSGVAEIDARSAVEVISRQLSGIDGILDRLRDQMIAASTLTEQQLMGKISAGGGLANVRDRDRDLISESVDAAFGLHWSPQLEAIARNLAFQLSPFAGARIEIKAKSTIKLSQTEEIDNLSKLSDSLTKLVQNGLVERFEARHILRSSGIAAGHIRDCFDANKPVEFVSQVIGSSLSASQSETKEKLVEESNTKASQSYTVGQRAVGPVSNGVPPLEIVPTSRTVGESGLNQ